MSKVLASGYMLRDNEDDVRGRFLTIAPTRSMPETARQLPNEGNAITLTMRSEVLDST